jgi:hypothetical protein
VGRIGAERNRARTAARPAQPSFRRGWIPAIFWSATPEGPTTGSRTASPSRPATPASAASALPVRCAASPATAMDALKAGSRRFSSGVGKNLFATTSQLLSASRRWIAPHSRSVSYQCSGSLLGTTLAPSRGGRAVEAAAIPDFENRRCRTTWRATRRTRALPADGH